MVDKLNSLGLGYKSVKNKKKNKKKKKVLQKEEDKILL